MPVVGNRALLQALCGADAELLIDHDPAPQKRTVSRPLLGVALAVAVLVWRGRAAAYDATDPQTIDTVFTNVLSNF